MMKMNKNKLLIQRFEEESELAKQAKSIVGANGKSFQLITENSTKAISNKATVKAVGFGSDINEFGIKEGDVIFLSKYSGIPINVEGIEMLIINLDEVLSIL